MILFVHKLNFHSGFGVGSLGNS